MQLQGAKALQLIREFRSAAAVQHPNVAQVHHAGFSTEFYFLVMQWIEGTDLTQVVKRDGPLSPHRALRAAMDAGLALAAVHEQNLVHRDVKPSNLILRPDETVCLTDFGLVRRTGAEISASLTRSGEILGTIQYMPPEQLADARQATALSDVYSLGATLYHLLTGRIPFAGQTWTTVMAQIVRKQVPRLEPGGHALPPEVVELVNGMMEPEEDRRLDLNGALARIHRLMRQPLGGTAEGPMSEDTDVPLPRRKTE